MTVPCRRGPQGALVGPVEAQRHVGAAGRGRLALRDVKVGAGHARRSNGRARAVRRGRRRWPIPESCTRTYLAAQVGKILPRVQIQLGAV